jgi:DNA-directed RNA polymerase specialized sigma24 family protein
VSDVTRILDRVQQGEAKAAEVVKLRYFVGMTIPEVAEALDIAPRTANRHWLFARAWLKRAIRGGG